MDEDDVFGEEYFPDPDEELMDPVDLDDIEMELNDHETEPSSKKTERVVEPPVELEPLTEPLPDASVEEPVLADDIQASRLPPETSFMSVASADERVYLRTRERFNSDPNSDETKSFLERPLSELYAISLELTAKRNEELAAWMAVKMEETGETIQFIEKYRPKSFLDLISDDSVNKQTLSWLNEWRKNISSCYSGATISAPIIPPGQVMPSPTQNKKILLLGGPPGVGKTALVDVCCRHFKFHIVESSASEDRGRAAMQKLITDVCGSRSVLDASKHQVLVIEEIDGEECSAADLLAEIIRKHPETIKRPIICICSDIYKKNLRHLREVSTAIQMTAPKTLRLGEKLKSICVAENIKIESLAIDRLISLCERDARSVLNQLQTLVYRMGRQELIRVADVMKYVGANAEGRSMDGAVKDNQKSEFELMQLLFEPKRSRSKQYSDQVDRAIASAKALPIADVFTHCFVTVPFTDVNMKHCKNISSLVSLTDVGLMSRSLALPMKYVSHWCPSVGRPRIDLIAARRLFAARYARRNDSDSVTSALVKSTLHSARASRSMMWSKTAWTLYLTRLLLEVLSPEHNPVWTKKTAKAVHPEIERIAKIYAEFGIDLVDESTGENGLQIGFSNKPQVYSLNPNLRLLSELDEKSTVEPFPIGSPMGDLLKAQVKIFLTKALSGHSESVELVAKGKRSLAPSLQGSEEDLELKRLKTGAAMSLASWRINPTDSKGKANGKELVIKKHPFEFRFNEGHTNAVRRVMHLSDFLPRRARD